MYDDGGFAVGYVVAFLVYGGIFAFACSSFAASKGKDGMLWGVIGFLFGLLGLLIIAIMPEEPGFRGTSTSAPADRAIHRADDSLRFVDPECPVNILSASITVTEPEDRSYFTLSMRNLGDKEIKALKLQIKTFDSFWSPVTAGGAAQFEALVQDLAVAAGRTFGQDKKVMLGAFYSARHIDVEILSVAYADGSVWERGKNSLVPVSEREMPADELLGKLQQLAGRDAMCLAQDNSNYWICVCGHFNPAIGDKCGSCQREKAEVLGDYGASTTIEAAFAQQEANQAAQKAAKAAQMAEEALKAQRQKKKNIKIATVATVACLVMVVGIFTGNKFNEIQETKRAAEQADASPEKLKEFIADLNIKDIVFIGRYEQDNDTANGKEPVAWRVLAVDGNKKLLISEECLDFQPYNTEDTEITWEKCTLRSWLNGDFINAAFTLEQQKAIAMSQISNPANPEYGTPGGNDTQDKIFLLSIAEAGELFASDEARRARVTPYAKAQGAYTEDDGMGWWWLRSPGRYAVCAAMFEGGSIRERGYGVDFGDHALRPALWLDLSSY